MSRLTIDISDQQHQRLKAMAAMQGKTIRQYALERLFPASPDEERAWEEVKALLDDRIAEANERRLSAKSVKAIVDEELAADPGP